MRQHEASDDLMSSLHPSMETSHAAYDADLAEDWNLPSIAGHRGVYFITHHKKVTSVPKSSCTGVSW